MKAIPALFILAMSSMPAIAATSERPFNWAGATVYFVITDRFCNGDTTNDVNYGRIVDYGS